MIWSYTYTGPYPQYGWDCPEEIPDKFRKDPGNALRAFPECPSRVQLRSPKPYNSRHLRFLGRIFFQKWFQRGPLRAGHGIPSSTEGISDIRYNRSHNQSLCNHNRNSDREFRCSKIVRVYAETNSPEKVFAKGVGPVVGTEKKAINVNRF